MITSTPPPDGVSIPIVHKILELYKNIYAIGKTLPKNEKLGLHLKLENLCLNALSLSIESALSEKQQKILILLKIKIQIEIAKHLVRMEYELKIINLKKYVLLEKLLIDISKMTTGWMDYCKKGS